MANERGDRAETKLVRETGIALVLKGERISAKDEAKAELTTDDTATVVNYHFPVEIEVRGGTGTVDAEAIARHVYEKLAKRMKESS